MAQPSVEAIERSLLLEAVFQRYGYDFREYAPASLGRRLRKCMETETVTTLSGLQEKLLHDPEAMERFLLGVSVVVTAMFRDPDFYAAFRARVVPAIRDLPFVRFWHAGCSTGEEALSMAMILEEERLLHKCRIYATDLSEAALQQAKAGIFPLSRMKDYTKNYLLAGGKGDFSDFYTARYDHARFRRELLSNIVWAQHNLVTDASFNEFHVILCRNVLIYFNKNLQDRVHSLLWASLASMGYLCLGTRESLQFTPHERGFEAVDAHQRIFRRTE